MAREAPWPVTITPRSPVACGALLWRKRGQLYLTMVVKATFGLRDGADMVLEAPAPIVRGEVHHGNVPTRSVRATTDLSPFLRQAEVILTGHAYAAGGPVTSLAVRLTVLRGEPVLDKSLLVVGDRRGDAPPAPFARMPLVYERAYGGVGWRENPFGVGAGQAGPKAPRPNVLDPLDPERTAGFGPIARGWPARKQLLDAEARKALEQPIPDVPESLDWAYFQAAPPDQRIAELHGDEWIELAGLHPGLARLRSRLPGLAAAARVHGLTEPSPPFGHPLALRADALRIDSDEQRCTLVWRGVIPVRSEEHAAAMHVVVALERPGEATDWPEAPPEASAAAAAPPRAAGDAGVADDVDDAAETLVREPKAEATVLLEAESPAEGTQALTPEDQVGAAQHRALPFHRGEPAVAPPGAPPAWASALPPMAPSPWAQPAPPEPPPEPPPAQPLAASRFFHELPGVAPSAAGPSGPPPRQGDAIPVVPGAPLAAFTIPWQVKPPRDVRVVIVKASFDLVPGGRARLRPEPDFPSGDVPLEGDATPILRYPSDFAIFKPRADVTLTGYVGAAEGAPPAAQARFVFGEGEAGFDRRVPLGGERRRERALVPAFAPVAPDRTPSGTYDARWRKERWPWFPEDFDWARFQSAPPAQQLAALRGDEPFVIDGMHREHARIEGKLPALRARAFAQRTGAAGGELVEVLLRLDTAHFEAEALKLTLVWRGLLEVRDDDASDIAELFVMAEELSAPPARPDEVLARYRAARAPREPEADEPEAAPPEQAGAGLVGAVLAGPDLAGLDLTGRSFAGADLMNARLAKARLSGVDLRGAQLAGADLRGAALDGADLTQADLTGACLEGARLDGALLTEADLGRARAAGASFRKARGERPSFAGADLAGARFEGAAIEGADLTSAALDGAAFDGAELPAIRLYDARGERVSFREAKIDGARADGVSLAGAALDGARADGSIWDRATLDGASFLGATLRRSSFARASAERAIFSGADLVDGRLGRARLAGASFLKANLMRASLESADLAGADLRGANLHAAETWKANLEGARLELALITKTKLEERP